MTSSSKGLLPCPFCGSDQIQCSSGIHVYDCHCLVCGAIGPDKNGAGAIERWNTRAHPHQLADAVSSVQDEETRKALHCAIEMIKNRPTRIDRDYAEEDRDERYIAALSRLASK